MTAWEFLVKEIHESHEGQMIVLVDDGYEPISLEEQQGISEVLAGGKIYRVVFARRRDDAGAAR